MGMASVFYDVLNKIVIDSSINPNGISERLRASQLATQYYRASDTFLQNRRDTSSNITDNKGDINSQNPCNKKSIAETIFWCSFSRFVTCERNTEVGTAAIYTHSE